jgi:hypothetical protein
MKTKTINITLGRKFDEWAATLPEPLHKLVERDTVITGGAIASMLLREQVNDFDIYFRTHETALAVATHYIEVFRKNAQGALDMKVYSENGRVKIVIPSAGIASEGGSADYAEAQMTPAERVGEECYRPVFLSANAITLSHQVQLVLRFIGEPGKIHESYDFVHCTNYWTSRDRAVVLNQPALEALLTKELRYVGSLYPLCSIIRTRKFIQRGWSINAGQYLKMALQLQGFDLTQPDVLEDQLTGVDYAYFQEVIRVAREIDSEKINATYLATIVDRMF